MLKRGRSGSAASSSSAAAGTDRKPRGGAVGLAAGAIGWTVSTIGAGPGDK